MFAAIKQAFRTPDIRKKIFFTLALLALYRVGCYIPVPGAPYQALMDAFSESSGGALMLVNIFSGNALSYFSVFSLGIMPYITASIIMQLMRVVIPAVERWSKDEAGQKKITQITRYVTLVLAFIEAIGYLFLFTNPTNGYGVTFSADGLPGVWFVYLMIIAALVAGTALIMRLGELITQKGVGNGMSLIIFLNVLSGFPSAAASTLSLSDTGWVVMLITIACAVAAVPVVVYIERAQRRIPVNYARRQVSGGRSVGGQSTYIPFKVNMAGVIAIIFASCIIYFPVQIAAFFGNVGWVQGISSAVSSGWVNWILMVMLIVLFSYFYTSIVFNPKDMSDNLRQRGGFIPGIRPGRATEDYLHDVVLNIVPAGAVFIAAIAVVPSILFYFTSNELIQAFGGTSILIMVSVALDTMLKVEAQLATHNYEGYFK